MPRSTARILVALPFVLVLLFLPSSLSAYCLNTATWAPNGNSADMGVSCVYDFTSRCYNAVVQGISWNLGGCNPLEGSCSGSVSVSLEFPGNHQNDPGASGYFYSFARAEIWKGGVRSDVCGNPGAVINTSLGTVSWPVTGSCSDGGASYTLKARMCPCDGYPCALPGCDRTIEIPVSLGSSPLCQVPEDECDDCESTTGGVADNGGGGSCAKPEGSGPGASLRYRSGGIGKAGNPGSTGWTGTLGRFWSHDYAERIVMAPDENHVYFVTKHGSYREFSDLVTGTYTTNSPVDEHRTLTRTATGWELASLDGTVVVFDEVSGASYGRWASETDAAGNTKTATYNVSDQLETVTFPDGRSESFTYYPSGKLETISEIGVDGTTTRTWTYTWTGDDLTKIDRPDGTALEFFYTDASNPGYLTRQELVGTDGTSRRVMQAWEYDGSGRVTKLWKGDASFAGTDAVDTWELGYTTGTTTDVTDPLGSVATYTYDREEGKTRIQQISGNCPTCGLGPNSVFEYNDTANPLEPTAIIDGKGNRTEFTYDANGMVLTKTEAFGDPEQRTTTWEYTDTNFPGLPTAIIRESTSGAPSERRVDIVYDSATGNPSTRTISGVERGSAFSYVTSFDSNAAGEPNWIDPPGYTTTDRTEFGYTPPAGEPARGALFPFTRTDPLVGVTTFGYDAFNRRDSVTDANAVETETTYDALNRVTSVTQKGATTPEDLVTLHEYNLFGDLERTTLPEGNVIEYEYDPAGRLETVSRGAVASTPLERTVYGFDKAGNRTQETQERWDAGGSAWVVESETDYVYSARCQLEKVIRAPGTADESVTEYGYDCNGNLEKTWDGNHPSGGGVHPASTVYGYDALDRLTTVTQPWAGTGGGTAVTSYGYDVQDHLTQVTDAEGNVTTYVYSDRDLMTEQVSPASGQTDFTYNEHGELLTELDARAITTTRTVDAADRVTFVDLPNTALDTTYSYGSTPASFDVGRLTGITRNGQTVTYGYDRFGRVTQDGDLGFTYDGNGNRETVTYLGSVVATYTFDFADRAESVTVDPGGGAVSVASAAGYYPSGPLKSLTLGNGLTETRLYDSRYFPDSIDLSGGLQRTWDYTPDKIGNILSIDETVGCAATVPVDGQVLASGEVFSACQTVTSTNTFVTSTVPVEFWAGQSVELHDNFSVDSGAQFVAGIDSRLGTPTTFTYTYQDYHYFLTGGTGPWGALSWTYDKTGNRLTELRDGNTDTYNYPTNGTGNTPVLSSVTLAVGGSRDYTFGTAGHLDDVTAGANVIDFTVDDAGRMSGLSRMSDSAAFTYDGRSFLTEASVPTSGASTEATYSSDGVLHSLARTETTGGATTDVHYIYFAGRPVAQLEKQGTTETWTYLTTDHLGTPAIATDTSGNETWIGPFEPFGEDYLEGTAYGASQNGIYLRFPGQWDDGRWSNADAGADIYYNLHRWYEYGAGRYGRVDPLGAVFPLDLYLYSRSNPALYIDPNGLAAIAGAIPAAAGCALLDGPLPIGDIVAVIILGGAFFFDQTTTCSPQECGDCTPAQKNFLQGLVDSFCKSGPRRCKPGQDLRTLKTNYQNNMGCAAARQTLNDVCFGGGDAGHKQAADDARRAARRCTDLINGRK